MEKLVKNGLSGSKQCYSKELKQFSVTLQYYSPKAYLYVRKTFNNLLPNPRTLRRWYMVVDGNPGFTMESFESISKMAKDRSICCNLVIDEMCIRRHVEMDSQRKIHGYINMGAEYSYDNDNIPEAKNALVFLVVGINGYWKMPIAYFLIDGLSGKERANLLKKAIELLCETGVTLCSVTFDGAKVNLKMCTELGASFSIENPRPYLLNDSQDKLFCFYDPAHMLKLIRNAWNNRNIIKNSKGEEINWKYVKKLYELEQKEGLRLGTKLTKRHINFHNEIMNVRLAAQTLRNSVADALTYLSQNNDEFTKAGPTSEFIKYINNAFDILNSRNKFSTKPYGKAISVETIPFYTDFINKFIIYIKGLEFSDGKKIINSNRNTGFVGMIMSLTNAVEMFSDLRSKGKINYLITYKISQDHIETTFSAIRSRLGYNNNPTCKQFKAAYKRILVHNEIVGSEFGNCSILDNTKMLTVNSCVEEKQIDDTCQPEVHLLDHDYFESYMNISKYVGDTSQYIAGFVIKKILKSITCSMCQASLITNNSNYNRSTLISIKNRGSLIFPSRSVVLVCQETERLIRSYPPTYFNSNKNKLYLLVKIKQNLYKYNRELFSNCPDQESFLDTHKNQIIKLIVFKYVDIRVFHEVRKVNDINIKSGRSRAKFTKMVLFNHE